MQKFATARTADDRQLCIARLIIPLNASASASHRLSDATPKVSCALAAFLLSLQHSQVDNEQENAA
ncbi:hypothetical protein [Luteibacter sp. ME-Dv--P-043b]|uniref:hypothetical protein n=1 Tax=Luteibacter sp. ME-Dv--P-043b TaxID=3040291 RepID=UPI002554F067|nr:hypothetical protein [Luteibacter sp. ME-Dv--P-043b]